MSINSKHSGGKNEKSGRRAKRKKTEESEDLESSEEELDLTKECHPIGYYMSDRAEMINQMFSVIKGVKLKAMLPPILKDCDLDLLKLQCLDQLLGMSEKRIACILSGETLETSSESDVESKDYDSDVKNKTSSGTASNGSDELMEVDIQNEMEKKSRRKAKRKINVSDNEKSSKADQNNANPPAAEQGKTLLEILELEMRARAIRALLKQNESVQDGSIETKASDSKENGIKDVSDEVVDLTGCEDDDYAVVVKKEQPQDSALDENVSTFEDKVEKSQTEKGNQDQEDGKSKRLQAELELRNKLFKKKSYRTKQQRMENEENEEEKVPDKPQTGDRNVNEDPEEGEVSSSEEGVAEKELQEGPQSPSISHQGKELSKRTNDLQSPATKDSLDNEINIHSVNNGSGELTYKPEAEDGNESRDCINLESEDDVLNIDTHDMGIDESDAFNISEETSWRERWLRKDGVQKLVKSSKIYAKVKKRIAEKSQRFKEETNGASETKTDSNSSFSVEVIEGSIKEYEKLVGKTVQAADGASTEDVPQEVEASSDNIDVSTIVCTTSNSK